MSTTPLGFEKPDPGASDDEWGYALNRNVDRLDTQLQDKASRASESVMAGYAADALASKTDAETAKTQSEDARDIALEAAAGSGGPLAYFASYDEDEPSLTTALSGLADGIYEILADETHDGAATRYTVAAHVATYQTTLEAVASGSSLTRAAGWDDVPQLIGRVSAGVNEVAQALGNNVTAVRVGVPFDAAFAATIGGYPKGAQVLKADGSGYWISTADANSTDPDVDDTNWISEDSDKYINGAMAFSGAVNRRQYDRNTDEVSLFEVIDPALIASIRDGTITSDLSTQLQAAFSDQSIRNFYVPDGIYPIDAGLTFSLRGNVRWSANAVLVPRGSGVTGALLTIDGSDASADPSISEEHAIRTRWDRIRVDGLNRPTGLAGVVIKNILRSDFGAIICENLAGSALAFTDSVKESTFDIIRSKYCGEIIDDGMGGFIESPVLDIYQPLSARDPHNNLHIGKFFSVYGMGPDLRVDGSTSNPSKPRRITVDWMMIHGSIDTVSPPVSEADPGDPYKVTDAQRVSRRQIIVGNMDEVYLNHGSVQFASTAAYPIHVTADAGAGLVYFGPLRVHQRYDYSGRYGPASTYTGLHADGGEIINDGLRFVAGYSGHNSFEAVTGVKVHWNAVKTFPGDGSISIADAFEIFHRNTIHNFGAKELRNLGDLKFAAAAQALREGKSGSAIATAIIDYGATSARARMRIPSQAVLEFANQTAPTAASLIADGVGPCFLVVAGVPKFFDGTVFKTITVT